MSHLVIARKYRPQRFSDLVGQEHVAITLKNQIKSGREAHAYLFTGPRGVGKTSAARLLAKALRCLNLTPDFEPCNQCEACVSILNGSSMDVLEVDAASNTGVDNIRDLRENVNYAATVGKYRVYIVDEVHMLSNAAFNALLKTIEEPPPHVVFIFATTEIHKVPPTILSRCQRFDFRKIPPDVMMDCLRKICDAEKIRYDDGALNIITAESEGCLRDAQSILERALAFCGPDLSVERLEEALGLLDRASLFSLVRAIGARDPAQSLKTAVGILNKGTDPKVLLTRLVEFLCDLHYRSFTGESRVPDPQQDGVLTELCAIMSQDEAVRAMELALRTQASLHSNINAAITVEALVAKLALQRPAMGSAAQASASTAPVASATPARGSWGANAPSAAPSAPSAPANPAASARGSWSPPSARNAAPSAPASAPAPNASIPSHAASAVADGTPLDRAPLENFIRESKPAWTAVLQSLITLEMRGGNVHAFAKSDFAGKRLASEDGLVILRTVYKTPKAVVELDSASPKAANPTARVDSVQQKRTLAREHEAVKAAVKAFGATITEAKVLEDEKPPRK